MEKNKVIHIRVTENQYRKLLKEADAAGFENLSEYARNLLSGNRNQKLFVQAQMEEQSLRSFNPGLCEKINKELIRFRVDVDHLSGNWKIKEDAKERIENIWHLLN